MNRIAALGDARRIQVLGIAGVEPHPAATNEEALAAWDELSSDVAVLILTRESATALAGRLVQRPDLLVAVLP
ncbi:MAG TPA: hypothetical protein VET26_09460 [Candidatus Sulfotelmatobacter sp.]|nr:hypothetical protein [Candidatus Sulfotelmatobacter sp.]